VGTHDPENIETDVMNLFRTVYKLEKTFADNEIVRELVAQVSSEVSFITSSFRTRNDKRYSNRSKDSLKSSKKNYRSFKRSEIQV